MAIDTIISIIIFKMIKISYLSPYQRNLYYLAISLPFLSSIGLYYSVKLINSKIRKIIPENYNYIKKMIMIIIILVVLFFVFQSYFNIPPNLMPYKVIDKDDYDALKFLSQFPKANVLATTKISMAIYPVSGHNLIAGIYFYNKSNKEDSNSFFSNKSDCNEKQRIIRKYNVTYVLSKSSIDCNWQNIYNINDYIYKVNW